MIPSPKGTLKAESKNTLRNEFINIFKDTYTLERRIKNQSNSETLFNWSFQLVKLVVCNTNGLMNKTIY